MTEDADCLLKDLWMPMITFFSLPLPEGGAFLESFVRSITDGVEGLDGRLRIRGRLLEDVVDEEAAPLVLECVWLVFLLAANIAASCFCLAKTSCSFLPGGIVTIGLLLEWVYDGIEKER